VGFPNFLGFFWKIATLVRNSVWQYGNGRGTTCFEDSSSDVVGEGVEGVTG
jgi:hypothetical protein